MTLQLKFVFGALTILKTPQNGPNVLIQLKIFVSLFILAPVVHCVHFLTVQVSHFRVEMFQQLPASE